MATIDSLFELAIELRNKGELEDSIGVLLKIIESYPNAERMSGILSVLGGVYHDLKQDDNAMESFRKATELNPKSELASLALYIAFAELNRDEHAIQEMIRYLKNYPAKLYKDTLKELLEGLEKGHMTNYGNDIRNFAKINGVEI